jgi:hypothetical protein
MTAVWADTQGGDSRKVRVETSSIADKNRYHSCADIRNTCVKQLPLELCSLLWTQNNCELRCPLEVDTWEWGEDRKAIAHEERELNPFLVLYDVKTFRFRLQKYRNGGKLWVVNVFSFAIHAQTDCWQSRSPLALSIFFPFYCDVFKARSYSASTIRLELAILVQCGRLHSESRQLKTVWLRRLLVLEMLLYVVTITLFYDGVASAEVIYHTTKNCKRFNSGIFWGIRRNLSRTSSRLMSTNIAFFFWTE